MDDNKDRRIVCDRQIMLGAPIISGTRITVEHILDKLAAGESVEQVLAAYPKLTLDDIYAAIAWARDRVHDISPQDEDDMLPEYDFDYSKAKPNPYAGKVRELTYIALDPDVAEVFTTAEAVNKALRALIEAMPARVEEKTAA